MSEKAKFAVVGHPNKGKSSIVSTLSHDDSVPVSSRSGTTKQASDITVETTGYSYQLIDTPGFQRPRKVLAWLKDRASSAEKRSQAVADFIQDPQCREEFPDEVELLTPLVDGAAILYVVDGSRPYGKEYEAEMEILRWSGQSSMALINPIENSSHVGPWQNALEQYFKIVRVFNPMDAEFEKQVELLQAFSLLKPTWAEHLSLVIADLKTERTQQQQNSAIILARLIEDLCFHRESQKVMEPKQAELLKSFLEKKYNSWMVKREQKSLDELLANYKHFQTKLTVDDLSLPPDLFDCEQWYAWGLNKKQLTTVSAIAGAAIGGTLDLAVAGSSFMTGTIGGGLLGFASAWFGADKLVDTNITGLPLGGYEASIGPIQNKNFPYVVIGRFIFIYQQVSKRNHAKRGELKIEEGALHQQINSLEKTEQKELHKMCDKLSKQNSVDIEKLTQILIQLF